jgi:hypothetical protein
MTDNSERYRALMTMGIHAKCPHYDFLETHICPKATGWSPNVWEMNCVQCYRVNANAFDAYKPGHRIVIEALTKQFDDFLAGVELEALDEKMASLASEFDHLMTNSECHCGAKYSISAKPRCKKCGEVVFDSYFHFA